MDSPAHMTPLRQCWRIDRPPPNEAVGRRRAERDRALLQQWETVKQQAKVCGGASLSLSRAIYSTVMVLLQL